jgi:hypothetical protein
MSKNVVWEHPTEEVWIERRDDGKYYAIDTSGCQYRRGWEAGIIAITDTIHDAITAAMASLQG